MRRHSRHADCRGDDGHGVAGSSAASSRAKCRCAGADSGARPIVTEQALPYWRLSGFYLCYFALLGATAPFLGLYFEYLGFSPARIGELVAIPMLMRCVAPNLWGWLGDRSGKRLLIVRIGAFCTLSSLSLIFISKS